MNNILMYYSSLTKKVIMALAGLFLVVFLCVHLSINLLLLNNDDGKAFTAASAFMSGNLLIKVFEYVLFGGIILHIVFGLIVALLNKMARPFGYVRNNKSQTSFMSKYMLHTGIIILIFLLLHFVNFYFVKLEIVEPPAGVDKHDFYRMAVLLFTNKWYSVVYIVFLVFMGFHLNHSIQSAFQTMGWNHNKYNNTVKLISTVYSVIISGGFIIIPVYFLFFFR